MKNRILLLLLFLLIGKFSFAQVYISADAAFVYPFGSMKSQVDYGYGTSFNLGYVQNNKLDFSFSYELLNFVTLQPGFKIRSETLSFKYRFATQKKYNPYVGIKSGIFHSKIEVPAFVTEQIFEVAEKKDMAFGFAPTFGITVNSGFSDNLKFDFSTAYNILFFNSNYKYLNLKIGLCYYF